MTQQSGSRKDQFNTTTSTSPSVQESVSGAAHEVADQAKEKAGQVASQARQQVSSRLSGQKDQAAESLTSVAQALRWAGQQLREQDQGQGGATVYIDRAATQVEQISNYLHNKDVGELVDDVERFARRQPALFLGGTFVLGLLGARFLKSSRQQLSGSNEYPLASQRYPYTAGTYGQGYEREYGATSGYGTTSGATSYGTTRPSVYGTGTGTTDASSYGTGTGTTGTGIPTSTERGRNTEEL